MKIIILPSVKLFLLLTVLLFTINVVDAAIAPREAISAQPHVHRVIR